jgi:hypothetical protein
MRASGYQRVVNDFYIEPRWIVEALLDVEPLQGRCWDPACGSGNIPTTLQARGLECWGLDVVDHGFGTTGLDFFMATDSADSIISNPPYGLIEPFIQRALAHTRTGSSSWPG